MNRSLTFKQKIAGHSFSLTTQDGPLLHQATQTNNTNGDWDQIITCCYPLFLNSATELKNTFWSRLHNVCSNFVASHTGCWKSCKKYVSFLSVTRWAANSRGWCYKLHIPCQGQRSATVCSKTATTLATETHLINLNPWCSFIMEVIVSLGGQEIDRFSF